MNKKAKKIALRILFLAVTVSICSVISNSTYAEVIPGWGGSPTGSCGWGINNRSDAIFGYNSMCTGGAICACSDAGSYFAYFEFTDEVKNNYKDIVSSLRNSNIAMVPYNQNTAYMDDGEVRTLSGECAGGDVKAPGYYKAGYVTWYRNRTTYWSNANDIGPYGGRENEPGNDGAYMTHINGMAPIGYIGYNKDIISGIDYSRSYNPNDMSGIFSQDGKYGLKAQAAIFSYDGWGNRTVSSGTITYDAGRLKKDGSEDGYNFNNSTVRIYYKKNGEWIPISYLKYWMTKDQILDAYRTASNNSGADMTGVGAFCATDKVSVGEFEGYSSGSGEYTIGPFDSMPDRTSLVFNNTIKRVDSASDNGVSEDGYAVITMKGVHGVQEVARVRMDKSLKSNEEDKRNNPIPSRDYALAVGESKQWCTHTEYKKKTSDSSYTSTPETCYTITRKMGYTPLVAESKYEVYDTGHNVIKEGTSGINGKFFTNNNYIEFEPKDINIDLWSEYTVIDKNKADNGIYPHTNYLGYNESGEKYSSSEVQYSNDSNIKFNVAPHHFQRDSSGLFQSGIYSGDPLYWIYEGRRWSAGRVFDETHNNVNVSEANSSVREELVARGIKYGDLIKVAHSETHPNYVFYRGSGNYEDSNNKTTTVLDLALKRKQASCFYYLQTFNYEYLYGIDSAHNYGGIQFKNETTRRDVNATYESGNPNATAWARPNDSVYFKTAVCAGTNYAIENSKHLSSYKNKLANYSLSISGKPNARKIVYTGSGDNDNKNLNSASPNGLYDKYLITPSTANNKTQGIGCYNKKNSPLRYVVTGGYTENASNCRSVSNMDVGSGFSQKLTWTDYSLDNYTNFDANGSGKEVSVDVKVPYNYTLDPSVDTSDSDMIYPDGAGKQYKITLGVNGKANTVVSNEPYATVTKTTKIQVITYKLDSSIANLQIDNKYRNLSTLYAKTDDVVGVVRNNYNINNNFTLVSRLENKGDASGKGHNQVYNRPDGSSAAALIPDYTFTIVKNTSNDTYFNTLSYDENVEFKTGDKVCVVVAAYPADSHNIGNADVPGNDYYQTAALNGDDGATTTDGYWAISKPSCGTTGKRPNMSVESSWLYTTGNVSGSKTGRGGSARYYGSWAEYGIISTGNKLVSDFASSAAIAYQPGIHPSNANDGQSGADGGGNITSTNVGSEVCENTTLLTIRSNCNQNLFASSSNQKEKLRSKITTSYQSLRGSIVSRFEIGLVTGKSNDFTYNGSDSGLRYLNTSAHVTYDANKRSAVLKGDKTITLDAGGSDLNFDGNLKTIVIYAKDVVINSNIISNNGTMTAAGDSRAVIIIATHSIKIASNVTRVDAWLLTDGEINTCYMDNGRTINDVNDLALDICNQTLVIDAPVYASSTKLFRTAGGSSSVSGAGSTSADEQMKRAEVFNFNTVNYFWAQTDVPATETITTTDIKELPVRY